MKNVKIWLPCDMRDIASRGQQILQAKSAVISRQKVETGLQKTAYFVPWEYYCRESGDLSSALKEKSEAVRDEFGFDFALRAAGGSCWRGEGR